MAVAGAVKRFLPLFDRILVKRVEAITATRGGILIPEKAQKSESEATIVACGPGARSEAGNVIPMCVAVGDTVMLPAFGGSKVELEGEEYHMFREIDIVAKIAPE